MSDDSEKIAGMAIMSMARDIDELKAEIERLRASERSAWNAAVQRDEEIERLRRLVKEEQRDDLTTAALYGFHQRDDEVAALKAEIKRLRMAYEQERQDCINLTEKVIPNLRDEIERLRTERDEARNLAKQWSEDCGSEVLRLRQDVIDLLSTTSNQHRKIQQLNELLLKYQPKFDGSWL